MSLLELLGVVDTYGEIFAAAGIKRRGIPTRPGIIGNA
jgi:hypothetical protein